MHKPAEMLNLLAEMIFSVGVCIFIYSPVNKTQKTTYIVRFQAFPRLRSQLQKPANP